jgi:hypothetical protein
MEAFLWFIGLWAVVPILGVIIGLLIMWARGVFNG